MRVLHVAPSIARSYGGPTESLAGYVAAAASQNIEAHVVAPSASEDEQARLGAAGAATVTTFPSRGSGAFVQSPQLGKWVRDNAAGFDVVHTHGLFNSISTLSARAAIERGAAVIIRPFGTLSRYTFTHRRSRLKRVWFTAFERANLARARGIHFTTATERDEARWHNLDLDRKAFVVPPPCTLNARARNAGAATSDRALFVGRLNPVKNLEMLIEAWREVVRALPAARLEIAGSGDEAYEQKLRGLVQRTGLNQSVHFSGFLSPETRDEALANTSVFVLPSFHENFGVAALEAVAAGVPVVVSPHVQLSSFIEANSLGLVAADAQALAKAIIRVMTTESIQRRAATHGAAIAMSSYSVDTVGAQLAEMYRAVMLHRNDRQLQNIS
jgi:glycosyltransferase involved in cell wall biosynthesis